MALCVCEERHRPVGPDGRLAPLCDLCQARHDLYEAQDAMRVAESIEREDPCPDCRGTGARFSEYFDSGSERPYMSGTKVCPTCDGTKKAVGG